MSHWPTSSCKTNGIELHYTRTGGKKPPLILLHGLAANGSCWAPLARALEEDYDVIMPDARGHGKSTAAEKGYRYEELANDVTGLLKTLGVHSSVLIGHSMGGLTAAVVASRKPNLLRGLVLADPTFLDPEVQRQVFEGDSSDRHRQMLSRSLDELVADGGRRHPGRSSETVELIARARLQTSIHAFDILTPPNPDYAELVRAIGVRTLLVIGDAGVVSPSLAMELQRVNSKIQVEEIPDAGHGIQYDQPDRFAAVVKRFLSSLP